MVISIFISWKTKSGLEMPGVPSLPRIDLSRIALADGESPCHNRHQRTGAAQTLLNNRPSKAQIQSFWQAAGYRSRQFLVNNMVELPEWLQISPQFNQVAPPAAQAHPRKLRLGG